MAFAVVGSWAGRRAGQSGPPPRDIDVLVVGNLSRADLLDVADAAQQQLHTKVNIRTITPEEWAAKDQPFLMTVASRPLIALIGPGAAAGHGHARYPVSRSRLPPFRAS